MKHNDGYQTWALTMFMGTRMTPYSSLAFSTKLKTMLLYNVSLVGRKFVSNIYELACKVSKLVSK